MTQHPVLNKIIMGVAGFLLVFTFTYFKDNADTTTALKTEVSVLTEQLNRLNSSTATWVEISRAFRNELVLLQVKTVEKEGEIKVLDNEVKNLKREIYILERELSSLKERLHAS